MAITDTAGHAIDERIPPLLYGVWVKNQGWLADDNAGAFQTLQIEVAHSAARLWGWGAQVMPYDASLTVLQRKLLQHQRETRAVARLRRWINGLRKRHTATVSA